LKTLYQDEVPDGIKPVGFRANSLAMIPVILIGNFRKESGIKPGFDI